MLSELENNSVRFTYTHSELKGSNRSSGLKTGGGGQRGQSRGKVAGTSGNRPEVIEEEENLSVKLKEKSREKRTGQGQGHT